MYIYLYINLLKILAVIDMKILIQCLCTCICTGKNTKCPLYTNVINNLIFFSLHFLVVVGDVLRTNLQLFNS